MSLIAFALLFVQLRSRDLRQYGQSLGTGPLEPYVVVFFPQLTHSPDLSTLLGDLEGLGNETICET